MHYLTTGPAEKMRCETKRLAERDTDNVYFSSLQSAQRSSNSGRCLASCACMISTDWGTETVASPCHYRLLNSLPTNR